MKDTLQNLYDRLVLDRPKLTLLMVLLATLLFASFIPDFKLDISADSLVLEQDEDLHYYRAIRARYGSDDYLIITYSPKGGLFEAQTLDDLRRLRDALLKIERVESVLSILDVPLLESPPIGLQELQRQTPTLDSEGVDRQLAAVELQQSPLYRNRLVGEEGDTTALQVNFKRDETYLRLRSERDALRERELEQPLSQHQSEQLTQLTDQFKRYSSELMVQEEVDIAQIREILDQHRNRAELHLGGLPMIVADMMEFVRHDLRVFGVGVIVILAMLLTIAFRQPRWVFLPITTALVACVITVGLLGLYEWRITIVSSNFITLLLIFSLSLTIHLVVRYRELQMLHPDAEQRYLVRETVYSKVLPSFYTVITTMVAFGSLVVSGIRPVIDFGWIMVIGLGVAFLLAFTLFPAVLMLMRPGERRKRHDITAHITDFTAHVIENHSTTVLLVTLVGAIVSAVGITRLTVDNRFIDYFKQETEIFQGMYLVDQKLGGTTPLDVVIEAPSDFFEEEELDPEDQYIPQGEAGITATSYWFNSYALDEIEAIHAYLDGINETGKVLSLSTSMSVLKQLNQGRPLDDYFMSILYKRLPEDVKASMVSPYISEDGNQLRFAVRVYESDVAMVRQALLDKIHRDLTTHFGLADEQVRLSGMMVLFNNMLQSLFKSQVLTLGAVFLAIMVMFAVLFRSIRIALIAIIPNLFAASVVLGLMGWLGVPLDIMTITIAAISVGIGVDDTIHYVHRYGEELQKDWDYKEALFRSHNSIGRAMYFTTVTITVGFSILVLSSFVPTIYFGILTAFAMVTALTANVTVLPILLEKLQPYGDGNS
ncbi:efflux RND transporter permease subunit [Candidatus Reidiella endopervernicosa]|uniref:RND family transporter n=1 Tax=Candidatus Reidiella endopervernicosa TaxID=2738883 RepID=A0A6N0HZT9_9GAMM|nr:MMPL family transporter [Candidatus Reidiella endopervernicosa]QKQ27829.1 RND family transporter [Candidatus Reidiella endopervernicosa]